MQSGPRKGNGASGKSATRAAIKSLIADLASKNGIVRVKARRRLVACRAQSVPQLMKALSDEKDWVRWEAAKALSQIGNAASTRALLKALSDERFEVRWLAAEGLIRIGRRTIVPLLEAAVSHSDSQWWREGIHHVLHDLNKGRLVDVLRPVLSALEGPEPSIEAPVAAKSALDTLKRKS